MPSPSPPLYLSLIFCFYLSLSLSLYFCPLVCVYVCACVPSVISPRVRSKFTQSQIDRNPLPKTTTKNERVLPGTFPFFLGTPSPQSCLFLKKKILLLQRSDFDFTLPSEESVYQMTSVRSVGCLYISHSF